MRILSFAALLNCFHMLGGALIHISPSLPELVGVLLLALWYFIGLPSAPDSAA